MLAINHRDRTSANDFELADAKQRWRLCDKREESSVPVALFEMLVNYHAPKQAETGGELAHPLFGSRATGTESDHVLGQDAGTR